MRAFNLFERFPWGFIRCAMDGGCQSSGFLGGQIMFAKFRHGKFAGARPVQMARTVRAGEMLPSIFFCNVISACNNASGRGGQPGICTSTGR
jgi:hypothetical protein